MIRGFFRELMDADGGTVLWHCVGGKDRTGMLSLLLLSVLGVDRETIISDYLLSNDYYADSIREIYDRTYQLTGSRSLAEDLSLTRSVQRDWIEQAYATLESRYGSVDRYLHEVIGISDADFTALQDAYLITP